MKIEIRDQKEKILAFDLKEVLSCIGELMSHYEWWLHLYEFVEIKIPDIELSQKVTSSNSTHPVKITREELLRLAEMTLQTENMELEGRRGEDHIRIAAIDTSFWELDTNNVNLIHKLRTCFTDIHVIE